MNTLSPAVPCDGGAQTILAALEAQLAALDGMGAHIAAAHVDTAIQQLRRDLCDRQESDRND
ncbi:hypothetical protein [Porphyrobacter sp. YT40]|uniref:hypothetical protein n=1 Tax=Porphyrobacter sp. YT40 TaxID=2547601 RepID=UPI001144B72D|nr:hypothetical protein [Porphyrobacter sp. YT40]QDH35028.1 hypothetical protein E2E27_12255 [Porphyrobacter sp. YT40]